MTQNSSDSFPEPSWDVTGKDNFLIFLTNWLLTSSSSLDSPLPASSLSLLIPPSRVDLGVIGLRANLDFNSPTVFGLEDNFDFPRRLPFLYLLGLETNRERRLRFLVLFRRLYSFGNPSCRSKSS